MICKKICSLSLFLLCALITTIAFLPSALTAQAMSDVWYPPACECNFGEMNANLTSKTTVVSYNNGKAALETSYKFSATEPTPLNCTVPFYCRQFEVAESNVTLSLNGSIITPTYGYSSQSPFFNGSDSYVEILALREHLSDIDTNISVHEFIVTATESTSFSFSLQESDRILYAFMRHSFTSNTRTYEVTITPNQPGSFIVFGNKPTLTASELCLIDYSEKTLDEYITEMVEFMTEMTNGADCMDVVTHKVYEFLSSSNMQSDDLFLDSCSMYSYAFLDFALTLPLGKSTIVVKQPMTVGLNSLYNPKVYVGKIYSPAQTAPLSFSVNTEQYVVDSTLSLKDYHYNGSAVESVTIAFCEVSNPKLVKEISVPWEPWRIALLSVGCVIGAASIVWLIIVLVKWKKAK